MRRITFDCDVRGCEASETTADDLPPMGWQSSDDGKGSYIEVCEDCSNFHGYGISGGEITGMAGHED